MDVAILIFPHYEDPEKAGVKLCMLHCNFALFLYIRDLPMLQYTLYYFLGKQSSASITVVA